MSAPRRTDRFLSPAAFALAVACAAPRVASLPKPGWVDQGTGAFKEADGDDYHGISVVRGIHNHVLAEATGRDQAKSELYKTVVVHICVLGRDYRSMTVGDVPDPDKYNECPPLFGSTPDSMATARALTKELMAAFVFAGTWDDPADRSTKTYYQIGRSAVDDVLIRCVGDNPKLRDFIRSQGPKAFEEELTKR